MEKYNFRIGIVGWSMGGNAFGAGKMYLNHLAMFGDVVILTPTTRVDKSLDLVVLPGGADTFSLNYGQVPGYFNSNPDLYKEFFVQHNLPKYIKAGIPVWGTCLGMQQLCVHFGETLVQNISGSHPTNDESDQGKKVHGLRFYPEGEYIKKALFPKDKDKDIKIGVCSRHHQAVPKNYKSQNIVGICYSDDGKYLEVFKHATLPVAGCQSHVEDDFNSVAMYLIQSLLHQSPNYLKHVNKDGNPEEQDIPVAEIAG